MELGEIFESEERLFMRTRIAEPERDQNRGSMSDDRLFFTVRGDGGFQGMTGAQARRNGAGTQRWRWAAVRE
jgi:hypothetical protein